MRIETRRFIMEELKSEDEIKIFAQISQKMAWRDTVELLLNEKKLEAYIGNVARRDMERCLSKRQTLTGDYAGRLLANQIRIVKQQNNFDKHYQIHMLKRFIDSNRSKVLAYRQQILDLCNKKGVLLRTDNNGKVVGIRNSDLAKIKNEELTPPIPIEDWHYNIQFLKPAEISDNVDIWENAAGKYVRGGIEANKEADRKYFYFKVIDKDSNQIVGISRICKEEKDFIVNYDDHERPIRQTCIGDPGLFLDPSCQGAGRGTEIYVTTLNVLYNFLSEKADKAHQVFIKCNVLNNASRKLQRLIGASVTNKDKPIGNRYYFTVDEKDILESGGLKKLERLGADTYTITIDESTEYKVSLRDGIIREGKNRGFFIGSIQKMMDKVRMSRSMPQVAMPRSNIVSAYKNIDKSEKVR